MRDFTTCKACGCHIRQRWSFKNKLGASLIAFSLSLIAYRFVVDIYF